MDCSCMQHTFLFILLALLVGQGDGRWKKSKRDILQDDIRLFKKMTEKIKNELETYYDEYSEEPFADYFLEEIDYLQNKIDQNMKKKVTTDGNIDINRHNVEYSNNDKRQQYNKIYTKNSLVNLKKTLNNTTTVSNDKNIEWPSFEDILTAMGKKYDWKNDRWIKVKNKVKDKNKTNNNKSKKNVEHHKHNFRYRIVKLNRAKSKRNIVIAVTAVR